MQYLSEQEIDLIASGTGARLKKERKARLHILPDNLGEFWEGGINGHFFRIRKGVEVELPESLAALIAQSADVKLMAEETIRAFKGRGKKLG